MDEHKGLEALLTDVFSPTSPPDSQTLRTQRTWFIARGVAMGQARLPWGRPRPSSLSLPRWAAVAAMLVVALLTGMWVGSADALPGDQLYIAKLAFERVGAVGQTASEQAENAAARRQQEVAYLVRHGRQAQVIFEGYITESNGQWEVAGIPVQLTSEQIALVQQSCPGSTLQMKGVIEYGTLYLTTIVPSCMMVDPSALLPQPTSFRLTPTS